MGNCGAKMNCNCPKCKGAKMAKNEMVKGTPMKGAYMDKGAYMVDMPFTKKFCKGY